MERARAAFYGVVGALALTPACSVREPAADTASEPGAEAQLMAEATPPPPAEPQVAEEAPPPEPPGPQISMRVGARHQELFVPMDRDRFDDGEIPGLFDAMEQGADPYCDYLWHRRGRDKPDVSGFAADAEEFMKVGVKTKKSIIAGCYNFVTMNDQLPDRDFETIRLRYPDQEFDCYSVGVMQPYLMQKHLGCRTLTMLDLDWEVHNMHWAFLKRFREGRMLDEQLDEVLKEVRATWVAFREPEARHVMGMYMLCGKRQRDRCREALLDFQAHFSPAKTGEGTDEADHPLDRITLQLASLHDADYSVEDDGQPPRDKVIFLSNAIEDLYTTKYQFSRYLKNLEGTLVPGQKAIFIHHVGGRAHFGVYELVRTENKAVVHTICKDPYENTSAYHDGEFYETWFDGVTKTTKKVPNCGSHRAGLKRKAKKAAAG